MTHRAGDRRVFELDPGRDAPEHEPAPAHVATADEGRRKHQLFAKDRLQDLHIFAGGNTSEQHDLAVMSYGIEECPGPSFERLPIGRVLQFDGPGGKASEGLNRDGCIGGPQSCIRRDDQHSTRGDRFGRVGRCRKPPGVRELAPEVQPADEAEDVTKVSPFRRSQLLRQCELGRWRRHHPRANAATVRR